MSLFFLQSWEGARNNKANVSLFPKNSQTLPGRSLQSCRINHEIPVYVTFVAQPSMWYQLTAIYKLLASSLLSPFYCILDIISIRLYVHRFCVTVSCKCGLVALLQLCHHKHIKCCILICWQLTNVAPLAFKNFFWLLFFNWQMTWCNNFLLCQLEFSLMYK